VLYRKLLELNAGDILHGSYGIEENEIVLSDALELDTMDFAELRSSYESMVYAATSHLPRLVEVAIADICHRTNPRSCTTRDFETLFAGAL